MTAGRSCWRCSSYASLETSGQVGGAWQHCQHPVQRLLVCGRSAQTEFLKSAKLDSCAISHCAWLLHGLFDHGLADTLAYPLCSCSLQLLGCRCGCFRLKCWSRPQARRSYSSSRMRPVCTASRHTVSTPAAAAVPLPQLQAHPDHPGLHPGLSVCLGRAHCRVPLLLPLVQQVHQFLQVHPAASACPSTSLPSGSVAVRSVWQLSGGLLRAWLDTA